MTGLAESTRTAAPPEGGAVTDRFRPVQRPQEGHLAPRWNGIGWLAWGVAAILLVAWFILFAPGELGSKADWFFGAVIFCVVMVGLWQTLSIQRQANQKAADAAERLRTELAAAQERSARELAQAQTMHQAEMEAQQKFHRAEMEAQRELARVERTHIRKQLQKQSMIEVSRAVSAHTQMLATLWNEGASILLNEDRDEREAAMTPIFEQISRVVSDFSVELDNAHLLIDDDSLNHALDSVNEAALMAIRVAADVHVAVVEGREPESDSVVSVQRLMQERAAEARRLAWDLLRVGLDDTADR
jgi:hypothetical protein